MIQLSSLRPQSSRCFCLLVLFCFFHRSLPGCLSARGEFDTISGEGRLVYHLQSRLQHIRSVFKPAAGANKKESKTWPRSQFRRDPRTLYSLEVTFALVSICKTQSRCKTKTKHRADPSVWPAGQVKYWSKARSLDSISSISARAEYNGGQLQAPQKLVDIPHYRTSKSRFVRYKLS